MKNKTREYNITAGKNLIEIAHTKTKETNQRITTGTVDSKQRNEFTT